MDACWLVLAADAPQTNWQGGGGSIGWPLVFGSICFMHTWLAVYAVHLGAERGQGVYFWMFLTLVFGPLAILALLRQPVLRTCGTCGGESGSNEGTVCPYCGAPLTAATDIRERDPRVPQEWDDDGLTQ